MARMCTVDGCTRPHEARGMCHTHYSFWRRTPEGRQKVARPKSAKERLEANVVVDSESGCWLWTASVTSAGYGSMSVEGKRIGVHRLAYTLYRGEIPPGLTIDHLCRNPSCVNPDHLEPVTSWENVRRGNISPPVANAVKTHCIHGHEFTPENTGYKPNGARRCKACGRQREREYYHLRKQ